VGSINFKLRFPGGIEELATTMVQVGSYASRRWLSLITGDALADEWRAIAQVRAKTKSGDDDA
jgi:hypothetical protein